MSTIVVNYYWSHLFNSLKGVGCNVILQASGVDIPTHKALLMLSSDYFRSYFNMNPYDTLVLMNDNPIIVQAYVDSLYSANNEDADITRLEVPMNVAIELYDFIDYYQIHIHFIGSKIEGLTSEDYGVLYPQWYQLLERSNTEYYIHNWKSHFISNILDNPILPAIGPEDSNWDWLIYIHLSSYMYHNKFIAWISSDLVQHIGIRNRWLDNE